MQNTKLFPIIGLIAIAVAVAPISPAWAQQTVDHSVYGELLESHVKHGLVDYSGFKKDEAQLDRYLSHLEKVDPRKLGRDEQMAFYINAYNAWTIKLILNHYPGVKSIKALGTIFRSPWKKKFVKRDFSIQKGVRHSSKDTGRQIWETIMTMTSASSAAVRRD